MCQRVPLIDSSAAGEAPGRSGDVSLIVLEQVRLGVETAEAKDENSG